MEPAALEPSNIAAATDRRTEANRRNSRKSTGPRTAEGKARSRRNALRHGLAAEVLVTDEERGAVAEAVAQWDHAIWPENVAEKAVVRRMAIADVRLKRCERAAEESLEANARTAVDRWRARKQNAARKLACGLKADPMNTLLDLEATAFGCDWLIRRWSALDRVLEQGVGWSEADREAAMRLLGFLPVAPGPDGSPEAARMWRLGRLAAGLEVDPAPDDEPNDPAAARAALRALIADRIDDLDRRAAESWDRVEGPERAAVIARSLSGEDGPDASLRHRYDRDAQAALLRAMTMLIRIRKRRDELDEKRRKEARDPHIEREHVGGGWWRQPDADACPPGMQAIPEPPAPATDAHANTHLDPDPSPAAPPTAEPSDRPDPPRAPRRNEPNLPPDGPPQTLLNPKLSFELRRLIPTPPPRRPERSRPDPTSPIDRDAPRPGPIDPAARPGTHPG